MIEKGSTVVLITEDATYCPCEIVDLGGNSITVKFFVGSKKNKGTGEQVPSSKIEVVKLSEIKSMSERL